jgi:L-lactate utilization protein LutB
MGKRGLVFVTFSDADMDGGLTYAIELAKTMDEDLSLLLVKKKKDFMKKFETLLTAISFAEADEHETARQVMAVDEKSPRNNKAKLAKLVKMCRQEGIQVHIHSTDLDAISGISAFLKEHSGIDKILLGPSMAEAENITAKDLTRLVRTASRPVVTMTRHDRRAA